MFLLQFWKTCEDRVRAVKADQKGLLLDGDEDDGLHERETAKEPD